MKITMDGKYRTRDGREVRILCTDYVSEQNRYKVVALIKHEKDKQLLETYTETGKYIYGAKNNFDWDLVPVSKKKKIVQWMVVWNTGNVTTHSDIAWTKDMDDTIFAVKQINIEVEEGEGL